MINLKGTLQIFCKAPDPGSVKTRLVPLLGDIAAAEVHATLTYQTIRSLLSESDYRTEVHTPKPDHVFFGEFGLPMYRQIGAVLGERMASCLEKGLEQTDKVVLIGTDCPLIDADYIEHAFQALDDHDVVLGPAEDGGYGLVGVSQRVPEMFDDIDWGTDVVLSQTCRKLNQLRINYALLPLVWDVDRPGDLPRYQAWLAGLKS